MINRTNTVLAVLLALVVASVVFVGVDYSQPNIEILPDMKYTPAWEAFAPNPNFSDGRTMQPPVPGTIARGQMPLYYAATKEDAVRAGEELENPHSLKAIEAAVTVDREATDASAEDSTEAAETARQNESARRAAIVRERFAESLERGGEVYRTYCVSCHGAKGAGDGPVTQRGFPPPPSMLTGKSPQMKDGQLFHILSYGQGSMAAFAGQLSRERRWDVINYMRDLQSKAPPPAESPPAESPPAESTPAEADVNVTPETAAPPAPEPQPSIEKPGDQKPGDQKPGDQKPGDQTPETKESPATPRNELREPTSDERSRSTLDREVRARGLTNDANGRE